MNKDSKILITGGQGFIGMRLGSFLSRAGFSNVYSMAGTRQGLDLGNDAMLGWSFDMNPDVVVHLATRLPTKENCLDYPAGTMYENLFVTCKVIEEARLSGCKKFISIWESSCYPEREILPYKESDMWDGPPYWSQRYYGNCARVLMELNMAFSTQFDDFTAINLVFPEVYGPGSGFNPRKNNVIESIISNVRASQDAGVALKVQGSKKSSRDFLYIDDAVNAIYSAINPSVGSNTYNISEGIDYSIKSLHEMVSELSKCEKEIIWEETQQDIKQRSCLNISLAKKELGWEPKTSIKEGLTKTLQWHDNNLIAKYISPDSILSR